MKEGQQNIEVRPTRVAITIGNVYEFAEQHNSHLSLQELILRRENKENFAVSAESALFWGGKIEQRIVITPEPPDPIFVKEIEDLLKVSITSLSPNLITGWVCHDLLLDTKTLSHLKELLKSCEVVIMPWGATKYYYELLSSLLQSGINIIDASCPSAENQWVISYSDSKIGSRSLLDQLSLSIPNFGVPSAHICHNRAEAAALVQSIINLKDQPLVIKSDRGSAGKAVRLITPHPRPTIRELLAKMDNDDLWQDVPILIEEAIGGGEKLSSPSYDGFIKPDTSITKMGVERMLILERQCVGLEMGQGVFPIDAERQMETVGNLVGEHLSKLGYVGWFDVDFLLPSGGSKIYASEINSRRGGATAPIELLLRMFGPNWNRTHYIKVLERVWLNHKFQNYQKVSEILSYLNEKFSPQGVGVIPLYTRGLLLNKPYFAYILYADSKEQASELEASLWDHLSVSSVFKDDYHHLM